MRTATVALFDLGELAEGPRARAIEEFRHVNVSHGWWEDLHRDFVEAISEKGFAGRTFFWDLDRDRHFVVDDLAVGDAAKLAESALGGGAAPRLREHLREALEEGQVSLGTRRVSHRVEKNVVEADTGDPELDRLAAEGLRALLSGLSDQFLADLDAEHDYLVSDEAVAEALLADGREFLESGEPWPLAWG